MEDLKIDERQLQALKEKASFEGIRKRVIEEVNRKRSKPMCHSSYHNAFKKLPESALSKQVILTVMEILSGRETA